MKNKYLTAALVALFTIPALAQHWQQPNRREGEPPTPLPEIPRAAPKFCFSRIVTVNEIQVTEQIARSYCEETRIRPLTSEYALVYGVNVVIGE